MEALVDGQVIINDKVVAVVPNSVDRAFGRGEINVRTQSSGNGNLDVVHSNNVETAKSMFKCSIIPTSVSTNDVDSWKLNIGANTIRYIASSTYETYEQMSVINEPKFPDSNDGVIEVEFEGKPLPR